MSIALAVGGVSYSLKYGSLRIEDSINMRSLCDFTIEDAPGTARLTHGMPVTVTDSINGLLFAGFVDQPDEHNLYPNAHNEIAVTCMDMHYLADKRRPTSDYTSMAAGDIVTDMLSKYLAAEGVTAGYALRRDSTNTDFAAGTLTGTTATLHVGDGDLELSAIGTDVTHTDTTTTDFAAGTLTSVDAQSNQLNLHASNAIKFVATNAIGAGNDYHYQRVYNGSGSQTIASFDQLTYDVWISSTSPQFMAAVDIVCSDGTTLRDVGSGGAVDQFNIPAHPKSDLNGFANDQWYSRVIDVSLLNGKTIQFVSIGFEGDAAGTYTAYFKNIRQNDSTGTLKNMFYDGAANPYNPGAVSINPNTQVSNAGYTSVTCVSVTVYEKSGSRISPAISIDAAKIPKSSLVSWTSLIPNGATFGSSPSGSTTPLTPANTSLSIYTSIDEKGTWQTCAFKAAAPDLMAGCNIATRNIYTKVVLAITDTSPEVSPVLADLTVTVTSSYNSARADVISTIKTQTDFNTGTYTNTAWDVALTPNYLSLSGITANFDTVSGVVALPSYLTLFNSVVASGLVDRKRLALTVATGGDARARYDSSPNSYGDFTAQCSLTIPSTGNVEMGLVYHTTGWLNALDTAAYEVGITPTAVRLGHGTNGGASAYTLISSAALPATLVAGSTYALTVIVATAGGVQNHKVYVDGILYINVNDNTYMAAGEVAFRAYNNSGGTLTYYFDNYGIQPALSGTWVSAAVTVGGLVGNVGNSVLQYDADIPVGCSVLCQTSVDGGSTWQTATSGASIPNVVVGSTAPASVQTRFTLTAATADQVVTVHAYTWWITNTFNATGTRVSPVLALTNVGRAGSSIVYWNDALPAGATLGVDASPDGTTWTDITANNGVALPTSLVYAQPDPFLDFFASVDSGNYSGTFLSGGALASWAFDTTAHRLSASQSTGSDGVYQYTGVSRADMYVEATFNQSDSGGLVARMVDANNAYFLSIRDASAASSPNTVQLKKIVAGTISSIGVAVPISFTRGDYHIFRLDVQGTTLTVYMDNALLLSATNSSVSAAGMAGLYAGATHGDTAQIYTLRVQAYGDDVSAKSLYTRLRLATTNPANTPQVTDLTLSVHSPSIGNGATIASTAYAYVKSCAQAFDDLATQSTSPNPYLWYIDQNKKLNFRQNRASAAPFYVWTNSHLLWSHSPVVVSRPDMLYRNRQTVDGGFDVTSAITETRTGDGFTQAWTMTYPLAGVPTITQTNPAASLTSAAASVGVQGVDTGKDFYYAQGSNVISQDLSETPPAATDILSCTYIGQIPVRVTLDNVDASLYPGTVGQTQLAAIDGTTGIVEAYVSIPGLSKADATAHAQGLLQQYGYLGRSIVFAVKKWGLAPGQLVPVTLLQAGTGTAGIDVPRAFGGTIIGFGGIPTGYVHGITNAPFLITKVTTTNDVSVAGADPDLVDNVLYWQTIEATEGPFLGDYSTFFANLLAAK